MVNELVPTRRDPANGTFPAVGNSATGVPYVQVVDGSGNPVSGSGDATLAEQQSQTALLTTIANASLPDKETPTMLYRVKTGQSFTGAIAGDPILGILTINTVTNTFVSENPIWYNGRSKLAIANADVDTSKLEIIAANSLTASELATITLSVGATARVCTGTQMITGLSAVTAASLTVPALSVVAEIQADGGIVRIRRDGNIGLPTATTGWRVDDGMSLTVDCVLANVRLLAQSGTTTNVQIAYFDRV